MKNLLNFFLKYNYWFLFVLLEIISFALLFRFNSYQGSAFFTSANFVSGAMYDAANNVTGYFHLKTINDELVQKNVELELQLESIRKALIEATEDSSGVEQLKQEALAGYDIFKASVINNSVTHADNYITLDKGEVDGIRSEMGVGFLESIGTVISSIGNMGPGLGTCGPAFSWSELPDAAKWLLSFLMLLGRLELFTVLLLFTSDFWKKN